MRPAWFPDWSGEIAAIVAGGESVTPQDVEQLRRRCRVVVINDSYRLAPWADLLYVADERWWDVHWQASDAPVCAFHGFKVTPSDKAVKRHRLQLVKIMDIQHPEKDRFGNGMLGRVSHGGNGGFQATDLVLQFGARSIIWLGFDMCGDHWHGRHKSPLRNPTPQRLQGWAATLDAQADRLKQLGATVINCSAVSVLKAYPKMSVRDALAHLEARREAA